MKCLSNVWKSVVITYTAVFKIQELPILCQQRGVNEGARRQVTPLLLSPGGKNKIWNKKFVFLLSEKIKKFFARWREMQ